jgi:uncharacterized protein
VKSWVFDTNVIVAAHLSPHGPPARLLSEVYARRLRLSYDARIAAEYRAVLGRKKFSLLPEAIRQFMRILGDQDLVTGLPLRLVLPDPEDAMFIEVASATNDRVLVTGNVRHYPSRARGSVTVLTPAEAWDQCRKD